MNFVFWGDGSQEAKALVDAIRVRSTENFNWTFIFILSMVFYVYWSEINKKNTEAVCAGLALYGVHWLYEMLSSVSPSTPAVMLPCDLARFAYAIM